MDDKRSHARHPISLDVSLVDALGAHRGRTRDLSLGGMFVCTKARLVFGGDISVQLRLPAIDEDVTLPATVRWQTSEGVGVGFRSMRARHVWALNVLFKTSGFLR